MGAILSFLGGSAFRMVWGEVSSFFTRRQEHKIELQRMEAQGRLDAAAHGRNIESLRVQAELGVKTIQVQADADALRADGEAFSAAMARAAAPTGIKWVDAWNGAIRPAFATVALYLWVAEIAVAGWVADQWSREMIGVVAGFYFADRTLRKLRK